MQHDAEAESSEVISEDGSLQRVKASVFAGTTIRIQTTVYKPPQGSLRSPRLTQLLISDVCFLF